MATSKINSNEPNELAEATNLNSATTDKPTTGVTAFPIRVKGLGKGVETYAGPPLKLTAQFPADAKGYQYSWTTNCGSFEVNNELIGKVWPKGKPTVWLATQGVESGDIHITVEAKREGTTVLTAQCCIPIREPKSSDLKANFDEKMDGLASQLKSNVDALKSGVAVNLQRAAVPATSDLALWVVIRESTRALGFENYQRFMDLVLCGIDPDGNRLPNGNAVFDELRQNRRFLPFSDTDAYRLLKTATEAFLLVSGGVGGNDLSNFNFRDLDFTELNAREGSLPFDSNRLRQWWSDYLTGVNGASNLTIPYLMLVRNKLRDQPLKSQIFMREDPVLNSNAAERCEGVLRSKLSRPFFLELIWSYWHEEGMLVQTMSALSRRFQNVRSSDRDPLAMLEMDPLRPLNNLMWGFIQDEQHRLTLARRAYEYEHQYGISLFGRAVPTMRPADSRSKFIEAFHRLLQLCVGFFRQDDDTTVRADGFPILNALREVHLVLSQGAHNQFGDLPSTARQEMLLQQWLLARPEFREFLPTRIMVAYPEPWMDRVDAMKSLQGWTDTSVQHFHNLAVHGEQLLLSARYGAWNQPGVIPAQAANWARFWRAEIQSYIHAYRTATGVDLTLPGAVDSTPPSVHLRKRWPRRA